MQTADIDKDGDFDMVIPDAAGIKWYKNPRPAGNPRTGFALDRIQYRLGRGE